MIDEFLVPVAVTEVIDVLSIFQAIEFLLKRRRSIDKRIFQRRFIFYFIPLGESQYTGCGLFS